MDRTRLDEALGTAGANGYLIDASQADANQLYLSGFSGPDPFLTLYADGHVYTLVSGLEYGRAKREADADVVERYADYDYEYGGPEGRYDMYAAFVREHGADSVLMPPRGPVGTADALRERGIEVAVDEDDVLTEVRATKSDAEIEAIRTTQRANEAAMAAAEELLATADVAGEDLPVEAVTSENASGGVEIDDVTHGTLVHDGAPLTSERIREAVETTLLKRGCGVDETIVAGGSRAADPHDRGSGPLQAREAIIVDIFPRSKATGYHADMTRTFCVGEPSAALRERYDLTERALEAALDAIEPGVTGETVHAAACDVYEAAGYPTLRSDPETETGYIHSTGHGVGLDVHELPRLAPGAGELESGHVVTVEPGLYDPEVGGIRLEDLVVVTEDGYENLTNHPIEFVLE